MIREAVRRAISEVRDGGDDFEGYLDYPEDREREESEFEGDDFDEDELGWYLFIRNRYPSAFGNPLSSEWGIDREKDDLMALRNKDTQWTDSELRDRDRMMRGWIDGDRTPDDIGDSWEGIH